jgi:hypothetical protein
MLPDERAKIEAEIEDLEDKLTEVTDTGIARCIVVRIKELRTILSTSGDGDK